MKKAVIVMLMLLVLGIVGYFVYNEISVKEITYVSDLEHNVGDGRYSVKRFDRTQYGHRKQYRYQRASGL